MNHRLNDEAVAEDEAIPQDQTQTVMEILTELVYVARKLIAKHYSDNIQSNQKP